MSLSLNENNEQNKSDYLTDDSVDINDANIDSNNDDDETFKNDEIFVEEDYSVDGDVIGDKIFDNDNNVALTNAQNVSLKIVYEKV